MNILLKGYFDRNFGDDIMQCMIVEKLASHKIYVNCPGREKLIHLEKYDNVFINEKCENIDLCLYVIGTGFMYRGKRAKAEKLLAILLGKKEKKVKSAVINCSVEEFDGKLEKALAKRDIKAYSLITTRDNKSYEFFKENFRKTKTELFPDMVFAADVFDKYSLAEKNAFGVAPVNRLYSSENYDYYKKMAAMCDDYAEKENGNISLFAFDSGLENDTEAVLTIKSLMKYKDRAKIIIYDGDIYSFTNEIAKCKVFVTSRFHGVVAAAMCGAKVAAISDREKVRRLCGEIGIPCINKSGLTTKEAIDSFGKASKANIEGYPNVAKGHILAVEKFISE